MQVFMPDLARGAFTYAPPTVGQLSRAMEVDRRFADLGLGLVDGSVVALAESLGIRRRATRDVRHFAAVRLRDGQSFDLVVHPIDPDITLMTTEPGQAVFFRTTRSTSQLRTCSNASTWSTDLR